MFNYISQDVCHFEKKKACKTEYREECKPVYKPPTYQTAAFHGQECEKVWLKICKIELLQSALKYFTQNQTHHDSDMIC